MQIAEAFLAIGAESSIVYVTASSLQEEDRHCPYLEYHAIPYQKNVGTNQTYFSKKANFASDSVKTIFSTHSKTDPDFVLEGGRGSGELADCDRMLQCQQ